MPRVLNQRIHGTPKGAAYVGRPTIYGNPFKMLTEDKRDEVCLAYDLWIQAPAQAQLRERIKKNLKGKDLVCWCAPKRCHAETLLRIANED
jgi:hypothetical protein